MDARRPREGALFAEPDLFTIATKSNISGELTDGPSDEVMYEVLQNE